MYKLFLDFLPDRQLLLLFLFLCDDFLFVLGLCCRLLRREFGHGLDILGGGLGVDSGASLGNDGILFCQERSGFVLGLLGLLLLRKGFGSLLGVEARRRIVVGRVWGRLGLQRSQRNQNANRWCRPEHRPMGPCAGSDAGSEHSGSSPRRSATGIHCAMQAIAEEKENGAGGVDAGRYQGTRKGDGGAMSGIQ